MPAFKAYPTVKSQRNRKIRKKERREIFEYNKMLLHSQRKDKQKSRKDAKA